MGADPMAVTQPARRTIQSAVLGVRPGAHDLAEDRELAGVVGGVVCGDPNLACQRVAAGVGDRREEVDGRIGHHRSEGQPIGLEGGDALAELLRGGGRIGLWPVVPGPLGLDVVRVADVLEDVPG